MNFPASSAEVFTIDFIPDEPQSGVLSRAFVGSITEPEMNGRVAAEWVGQSVVSSEKNSSTSRSSRSQLARSASQGLDQFIGDRSNSLINWLWESLQNNVYDYWPLTIYGPSGVGKTKLACRLAVTVLEHKIRLQQPAVKHSLANSYGQATNSPRVLSVSGKDFFRSFRRSLEINSVSEWRGKFENADVLLIDDLHQLLDFADAQHELCEILDRRDQFHLPSLVVSHLSPLTMGLNPALASRLSEGFCCSLSAPGRDALLTIVQRLFAVHNTFIDPAEAESLLNCGVSEIGLINQIIWRWKLEKGSLPFQLSLASESLKKLVGAAGENSVAPEKVLRITAKQFECSMKDLRGSSRKSSLVRARGVAIWICRSRLNLSFKNIGKLLGNRDHTTIMNGMDKTVALLDSDSSVALATDRVLQRLGLAKR